MATLKEMIAAKKLAAATLAGTPAPLQEAINKVDALVAKTEVVFNSMIDAMDYSEPAAPASVQVATKVEPPPITTKPMTFAEKMAAKKREVEDAKVQNTTPSQATTGTAEATATAVSKKVNPNVLSSEQQEALDEIEDEEMGQAYSDIALRINDLAYTDSGDSLANAMSDLKKALHKNPAASMMLLDTDIGQMTIALRRYTHVELAEAAGNKTAKKAAKTASKGLKVVLTPEMLANQFADM